MQLILHNIKINLEDDDPAVYRNLALKKLGADNLDLQEVKVLKKSLDARDKNQFYYNLSLLVTVPKTYRNKKRFPQVKKKQPPFEPTKKLTDRPIIIGFGPAGIFAALTFIEHGIRPIIFERGKMIDERLADITNFEQNKELDPESNAQFGEGGAGTYSDGKLTTRIKETGYVAKVLETFIKFGAPENINYLNKPHLGTDKLCRIIKKIREQIVKSGGEINFRSKVTDLIIVDGQLKGVEINYDQKHYSSTIILAIGHSARDTYQLLHDKGVALEQKPFAVGVRIEHPAAHINLMQYGEKYQKAPQLDAADYFLTADNVFSFCMCPGGEIINASSERGHLALNGMSRAKRNSAFSNAAIVTKVGTESFGSDHPLAGIEFQRAIEQKAFFDWHAPAQNLTDFMKGVKSERIRGNSYKMGTVSTELNTILPDFVYNNLVAAFKHWQSRFPFFISEKAVLFAPETRTSSPVRIVRAPERQSVSHANLYPVGEGSGYAGGITSSAVDAIKTVEIILETVIAKAE
ncbi:MAG: FAD-dependent protein [bacterium]